MVWAVILLVQLNSCWWVETGFRWPWTLAGMKSKVKKWTKQTATKVNLIRCWQNFLPASLTVVPKGLKREMRTLAGMTSKVKKWTKQTATKVNLRDLGEGKEHSNEV